MFYIPAAGRHQSPNRHSSRRVAEIEAQILGRVYHRTGSVIAVGAMSQKRYAVGRERVARRNGADASDAALMRGLLALDNSAWMEFQKRYDKIIYDAIMKTHVGRLSSEAVSDAKADFYAALLANDLHKLRAFDPAHGNKLGTWIYQLAGNTARDRHRYEKRRPTVPMEFGAMEPSEDIAGRGSRGVASRVHDAAPSAFERLSTAREHARVIAALTDNERQIMRLRFEDGLSAREVAAEIGTTEAAVNTIIHRARKKIAA